jgi:hypothetical protein
MDTYEKLLSLVEPKYKIKVNFNKRIDDIHNKIDLKFIDGIYKNKNEERIEGGVDIEQIPGQRNIIVIL